MKKIIIFLYLAFSLIYNNKLFAQADISMVTHWNNRAGYNPASITRPDYIYLFSNIRNQWTDIPGAPQVINVQASGYIENLKSGFGISLIADKIGYTQALNPTLSYAFRLVDKNENSFSMGISAGVFSRSLNSLNFEFENPNDILNNPEINRILSPDANIGFEFQSRHFIAGISTTHLFSIGTDSTFYLNSNHRYGYMIFKNTDSELINYHFGIQCVNRSNLFVGEVNAGLRFKHPTGLTNGAKEIFELGMTYRTTRQMSFLFGMFISDNLRLGYAYDLSFIPGYQANGTHEIMLEYRIPLMEFNCKTCKNNDFWYH